MTKLHLPKTIHRKLYQIWYNMIRRCHKKDDGAYCNYGARGISVCGEWRYSVQAFQLFALSSGWTPMLETDRIDNNGNYEPSNVRFVTRKENCRNRRGNTQITIDGETRSLAEWAELSGLYRGTIRHRLSVGVIDIELLQPVDRNAYIEIDGAVKSYQEWANILRMPRKTFGKRVSMGMRGVDLLKPYKPKQRRMKEMKGE